MFRCLTMIVVIGLYLFLSHIHSIKLKNRYDENLINKKIDVFLGKYTFCGLLSSPKYFLETFVQSNM